MQDTLTLVHAQPFSKLAQSNIALLTEFSTSPEVTSLATANAAQLFQQSTESVMKLVQSGAYARVIQGMWKNYAEFLTDLGQNWMVAMREGHEALTVQADVAAESTAGSSPSRRGRGR